MLTLRDYAEGSWRFVAVCEGCGRVEPGGTCWRARGAHTDGSVSVSNLVPTLAWLRRNAG